MGASGPRDAAEGVVEELKGKAKEAVGAIRGDERLEDEGGAQRDNAAARREAAGQEAEAEQARAKAKALEAEQAAQQRC